MRLAESTKWNELVEQELTCAARAQDAPARKAHLELAISHLDAELDEPKASRSREMLSASLFTRIAFVGHD